MVNWIQFSCVLSNMSSNFLSLMHENMLPNDNNWSIYFQGSCLEIIEHTTDTKS
jgi:hypothetical protein